MIQSNVKRFLLILSLGLAYGFMYALPYLKTSFYDQMMEAMKVTNAELGSLMTVYAIACTLSYLPGGWIADKFKPKLVLLVSIFTNAALCFLLLFFYQNFLIVKLIWLLSAFTGGFAFWPAVLKGVRLTGTEEEQGRMYGIFEASNGLGSLIINFSMVGAIAYFAGNHVAGFRSAVIVMGVLCLLSGIMILLLFDNNATYGHDEDTLEKEQDSFNFQDFLSAFKHPGVWIISFLVFGFVTMLAISSYLTPYSTNVLGLSAVMAASIGTLRSYGTRFIGGPLGGVIADKVFYSGAKAQILSHGLCVLSLVLFMVMPKGLTTFIIIGMLLFVGVSMSMVKATVYSLMPEVHIPIKISGTAIAISTLIGYIPDMYVHTMFGSWLDKYGNDGYMMIFIYGSVVGVICMLIAVGGVILSRRYKRQEKQQV